MFSDKPNNFGTVGPKIRSIHPEESAMNVTIKTIGGKRPGEIQPGQVSDATILTMWKLKDQFFLIA